MTYWVEKFRTMRFDAMKNCGGQTSYYIEKISRLSESLIDEMERLILIKNEDIATLERQLAAAQEVITWHKAELAKVNALIDKSVGAMEILTEQARLQRAIDRIEAAGCTFALTSKGHDHLENYEVYQIETNGLVITYFDGATATDAAEQAAEWAESQKEIANESN